MGILVKPIITEKMTLQGERNSKFAFVVDRKADKHQIKSAVEEQYSVTVEAVNTMVTPGKTKTRFTKAGVQKGRISPVKKAVVTLKEGEVIDFYSNI